MGMPWFRQEHQSIMKQVAGALSKQTNKWKHFIKSC